MAESWVRSWNSFPAGRNSSAWLGRSPPADSTRLMTGSRFSRAICRARDTFFHV